MPYPPDSSYCTLKEKVGKFKILPLMNLFKKRKARYRLHLRFHSMTEKGPALYYEFEPMNVKACLQKFEYRFMTGLVRNYLAVTTLEQAMDKFIKKYNSNYRP